jgi:hypothetical protein
MIQNRSSHIDIILHDHPEPIRLISVSKRRLKLFFILTPLFILTLIVSLVGFMWWKGFTIPIGLNLPQLPSVEEIKIKELESQIIALEASNIQIQQKLTEASSPESELWLGPIKKPYALQDFTSKKALKIENISLEDKGGRRVLRFQLINSAPDEARITGHIFVFQIDSRGQSSYPAMTKNEWMEGIRFNKGETFAVSRLRPVEANFPPADNDARFLVIIFSREGDLLIKQEITGSAVVGP